MSDLRGLLQQRIEQALAEIHSLAPDALTEDKLSTTAWIVALAVSDLIKDNQ